MNFRRLRATLNIGCQAPSGILGPGWLAPVNVRSGMEEQKKSDLGYTWTPSPHLLYPKSLKF